MKWWPIYGNIIYIKVQYKHIRVYIYIHLYIYIYIWSVVRMDSESSGLVIHRSLVRSVHRWSSARWTKCALYWLESHHHDIESASSFAFEISRTLVDGWWRDNIPSLVVVWSLIEFKLSWRWKCVCFFLLLSHIRPNIKSSLESKLKNEKYVEIFNIFHRFIFWCGKLNVKRICDFRVVYLFILDIIHCVCLYLENRNNVRSRETFNLSCYLIVSGK